jgi:uncharacterized protein YndB with AHSA1/START domain
VRRRRAMTETDVRTRDLVVKRTFDAPAEDVWKAWSDPELVMRWWGPRGFTSPTCRMDFRVGGRTIVHMHAPAFGDLYNTWTYRAIEPHRWIEFVQRFSDEGGTERDPVELGLPPATREGQGIRTVVTFEERAGRTEMSVTESGWTSPEAYELSKAGLEQCLDKMEAIFTAA